MGEVFDRLKAALADRYAIEREIGAGGMATVYLARDLRHNRKVALKVLRPELAAVVGAERFLAEIRTTANLQHPHILPLFDSGETDGLVFYVMPFVEGESLEERLKEERQLSVEESVRIAERVAGALQYAHEHGVIHRDVKPANILLVRGEPLVADFGIALAVSSAGGGRLTETGLSLGTPHYMSPEQASGERAADARSDVYALGCVLYEMLVGEPPHAGPTAQAVLAKILTEDARRVRQVRHTVPPHVDAVVAKALERLPADRFGSAGELQRALNEPGFRHGPELDGVTRPPGARHRSGESMRLRGARLVPWAIAAMALIAVPFGVLLGRTPAPAPVTAAVIPLELRNPTDLPLNEVGPPVALSPDGSFIVYVGPDPEGSGTALWRRPLDRLEASPIEGTQNAQRPVIAPDGRAVYFKVRASNRTANVWRSVGPEGGLAQDGPPGGTVMRLLDDGRSVVPVWQPDGTPALRLLARGEFEPSGAARQLPAFDVAPDGGLAAWSIRRGLVDSIVVGPIEAPMSVRLAEGASPTFLDDRTLAFRGSDGALFVGRLNRERTGFEAPPIAMIPDVALAGDNSAIYAFARDGTLVYLPGGAAGTSSLTWVRPDGGEEPLSSGRSGVFGGVAVSPNGRRAAVWAGSLNASGDIWIEDLANGTRSPLTTGGVSSRPAWTPDGGRVGFWVSRASSAGAGSEVRMRVVDGDAPSEFVMSVAGDAGAGELQWSSDGRSLALRLTERGNRDIWVRGPSDTTLVPFAADPRAQERGPRFSPDGKWLAYVSDRSGRDEVYVDVVPRGGARIQVSAEGGREVVWARDGSRLFYRGPDGWMMSARLVPGNPPTVGARTKLFDATPYHTNEFYTSFDVAPDGRFLLIKLDARPTRADLVIIRGWVSQALARVEEAGR
jgi:serine/threonine-protein kinase